MLYKVGHHGSHNATLKGTAADDHANLSWMAQGKFHDEFVAMIPANESWARERRPYPWRHPLAAISKALHQKAHGRVLQADIGAPTQPNNVGDREWQRFKDRVTVTDLFIDCVFRD